MASEILPKMDGFVRVVPILGWLPHYEAGWFHADVIAGLTLWGILVPEGIAYAAMAGAPVQAGLYTLLGLPRCLRHSGNNAAGGLGPDLRVLDHDGDSRRAISSNRRWRIGRITRPVGPRCGDHFPAVRAGAARVRDRIHFAFGDDRFRLRAGDLHRREPSSQALCTAERPGRDALPALVSHWASGGRPIG